MIHRILLELLSFLKVVRSISDQNLSVAQRSYFTPVRLILHFPDDRDLHQQVQLERDQHLIDHQVVPLVLDEPVKPLVRANLLDQELQKAISENPMHQRKTSKQPNEERNTSSHFSQQTRMMIHFDAKRVSEVRNKRKMLMTSDRHSLIALVRRLKSETSSRSKNFLIKSASLSRESSENS